MEIAHNMIPFDRNKAVDLLSSHNIKINTVGAWERKGLMPARYFIPLTLHKFEVNGVTLQALRYNSGLSQLEFNRQFNARFNVKVSQKVIWEWECGHATPKNKYAPLLKEFYSQP